MKNQTFYEKFKNLTQEELDEEFFSACKSGNLEIVKYLLTSPDLEKHADIHAFGGVGIKWTCSRNHFELVKYLLTSPELKEHANIHADNDYGFKMAYLKEHLQVIQFLIFDMNIEKTEEIKQELKQIPKKFVEDMFELRNLNKTLNNELKSDKINHSRMKV